MSDCKNECGKVPIEEVVAMGLEMFCDECMEMAKNNWCQSQVEMLERLFSCVENGCDYCDK